MTPISGDESKRRRPSVAHLLRRDLGLCRVDHYFLVTWITIHPLGPAPPGRGACVTRVPGPASRRHHVSQSDQGLTPMLMAGDDSLVDRMEEEIGDFRPTLLLSPSPADLHPDHSAAAVCVAMALRRLETRIPLPELLEY